MKNILILYPDRAVMYSMPDEVYGVFFDLYVHFNVHLGIKTRSEYVYSHLPQELQNKIVRKEGKVDEFNKNDISIREAIDQDNKYNGVN